MQLKQGTLLQGGKYKIEKVLGQGGFGITYLATDMKLGKQVCIKEFFMKEYCNRDQDTSHVSVLSEGAREQVEKYRAKFVKEARLISSMNNPHIITIFDIFEENGSAYYTMEYLKGGSLKVLVEQNGTLSETLALKYISEIASALSYLHKQKVMHLDVKPSNIMLDSRGRAVLIDFGISKRYNHDGGQTSSTPVGVSKGYAPMEQYNMSGVNTFSPETDIYSLGATLYFILIGQSPKEANAVNEEGLGELPKHISRRVRNAIKHSMQPRRKDRTSSIELFVDELGISFADTTASPKVSNKQNDIKNGETGVLEILTEGNIDWLIYLCLPVYWMLYKLNKKEGKLSELIIKVVCSPVCLLTFIVPIVRFPFLVHNGIREGEEVLWVLVYIVSYFSYIVFGIVLMFIIIHRFMHRDNVICLMSILLGIVSVLFLSIPYASWLVSQCVIPPITLLVNKYVSDNKRLTTSKLVKWNLRLSLLSMIITGPIAFYLMLCIADLMLIFD